MNHKKLFYFLLFTLSFACEQYTTHCCYLPSIRSIYCDTNADTQFTKETKQKEKLESLHFEKCHTLTNQLRVNFPSLRLIEFRNCECLPETTANLTAIQINVPLKCKGTVKFYFVNTPFRRQKYCTHKIVDNFVNHRRRVFAGRTCIVLHLLCNS
jgi:hypothetical protein